MSIILLRVVSLSPYYVSAERYGLDEDDGPPAQPVSFGVRSIEELSGYPIEAPSEQDVRVLSFVDREGPVSKKEIIQYGARNELAFVADSETDSMQGKYRRLESHVMEGLNERGYVVLTERGRETYVDITEDGKNTVRGFSYLIN